MEHAHISQSESNESLSPDDIAYRRALLSAKEKHQQGGSNPSIHQYELNQLKAEGGQGGGEREGGEEGEGNNKLLFKKNEGKVGEVEGESEGEGGGENINISDKSDTINNNTSMNELSEGRRTEREGERRGEGGDTEEENNSAPIGTGGGGGASSGVMNLSSSDIYRRIHELDTIEERHPPVTKIRDAEQQPKAIASTFHPTSHLPPSSASSYRFHGVNEHMRTGGGKALRSQKMIMQPGGKYGQRY